MSNYYTNESCIHPNQPHEPSKPWIERVHVARAHCKHCNKPILHNGRSWCISLIFIEEDTW